jgi:hypothetical protein
MFTSLKKPRHKKRGGFLYNKQLLQRLSAELASSQITFKSLFCEQQKRSAAEQVSLRVSGLHTASTLEVVVTITTYKLHVNTGAAAGWCLNSSSCTSMPRLRRS